MSLKIETTENLDPGSIHLSNELMLVVSEEDVQSALDNHLRLQWSQTPEEAARASYEAALSGVGTVATQWTSSFGIPFLVWTCLDSTPRKTHIWLLREQLKSLEEGVFGKIHQTSE